MASSVAQLRAVLAQRRSDFARRDPPRVAKVVKPARVRAAREPPSPPRLRARRRERRTRIRLVRRARVGSFERISGVCDLLIESAKSGVKTSASLKGVATKGEPKVTDCPINADMAARATPRTRGTRQARAQAPIHRRGALTIPEELTKYMDNFTAELEDLRAMLRAMSIAGTSTQAFRLGRAWRAWTARLCAAVIRCKGFDAEWIDARDVLVVTDAEDGGVDVDYERSNANLDKLFDARGHGVAGSNRVLIATGFIARTPEGVPTTLKRNGSDYSATIFGAMLIAKTITIWTDVDGVFSADPRKVKEAVCLESLSYNEAWELSYLAPTSCTRGPRYRRCGTTSPWC